MDKWIRENKRRDYYELAIIMEGKMDLMLKNELYNPSFEDGNISELKSEPKNKVEINSMGLMEKSKEVTVNGNANRNDA